MNLLSFKESLSGKEPPQNLSVYLNALWYDAKGEWDKSHKLIQDIDNKNASWIHAYLHRKEGDTGNAGYWYSRAGKKLPPFSLEKEWEENCICVHLILLLIIHTLKINPGIDCIKIFFHKNYNFPIK